MSFFFRGKVWLRFTRDYSPYSGPVKYRESLVTAIDAVEAECLIACGYAEEYNSERRPESSTERAMGAASSEQRPNH